MDGQYDEKQECGQQTRYGEGEPLELARGKQEEPRELA
jgi:hypothetical protein